MDSFPEKLLGASFLVLGRPLEAAGSTPPSVVDPALGGQDSRDGEMPGDTRESRCCPPQGTSPRESPPPSQGTVPQYPPPRVRDGGTPASRDTWLGLLPALRRGPGASGRPCGQGLRWPSWCSTNQSGGRRSRLRVAPLSWPVGWLASLLGGTTAASLLGWGFLSCHSVLPPPRYVCLQAETSHCCL